MSNYIVSKEVSLDILKELDLNSRTAVIDGVSFFYNPEKIKCHLNSNKCIACGIESKVIRIERDSNNHYLYGQNHLNVYALTPRGRYILQTVDHAVLKSMGGVDTVDNLNTMCVRCNSRRGNHYPELQDFLDIHNKINPEKYWNDWDQSYDHHESHKAWCKMYGKANDEKKLKIKEKFLETSMHHHVGLYNRHMKKLKKELTAEA